MIVREMAIVNGVGSNALNALLYLSTKATVRDRYFLKW